METTIQNDITALSRFKPAFAQKGRKPKATKNWVAADQVKIILVDDLKDNLMALEGLLRCEGVDIFNASSGTEALELFMAHEFALALIDVRMPIMSGFELAELMRGSKKTKEIPIIFVTATTSDQTLSFKGYESGGVDFIRKPLDPYAVKSKVNVFIELYRQKKELKGQLATITANQKELQNLLGQLTVTQAKLEQAVQIRDDFMSIASHELKTPLTTLSLNAQLRTRSLQKQDLSPFTPERLAKMFDGDQRQIDRITHLIDDMLDISRISSGKLSMSLEQFDLCELVRGVVGQCSEQFLAAGCPVTISVCPSAFGIWDRFRLEQVVVNLLTNAMRYGAGKSVVIELTASTALATIIVRDKGKGIAKEDHDRIFQKFERSAQGSEISGLGLGLFIVKQILDAHQGSIRVESELGRGSAFIVELPLSI